MYLNFFKNYNNLDEKYLKKLSKISQSPSNFFTIFQNSCFKKILIEKIINAKWYIYITVLYFEQDDAGEEILNTLYQAKMIRPELDIKILVDWNRAKRNKIGFLDYRNQTNADWYYQISMNYLKINIPIFGIPINIKEILGVLHMKGCIFDNTVIYTGASISNFYLQHKKRFRYDRYHILNNSKLAKTMKQFIDKYLISSPVVQRLDLKYSNFGFQKKRLIKVFRKNLKNLNYEFKNNASNEELSVTPLIGLGKKNILNKTIIHLLKNVKRKIIICTPYFNFPNIFKKIIKILLRNGKKIEIILGDKTANDFYYLNENSFRIVNLIPYLYEINLRKFICKLQSFINENQLIIRIWKNGDNTYHLKGIWVDQNWQLITGNNLNFRSWKLDLENGILIHDPKKKLIKQKKKELKIIRRYTKIISNYQEIDHINEYPSNIKIFIKFFKKFYFDRLIRFIL